MNDMDKSLIKRVKRREAKKARRNDRRAKAKKFEEYLKNRKEGELLEEYIRRTLCA